MKKFKAEIEELTKECCLLNVLYGLLHLLSYTTLDKMPRGSMAHSELGTPTSFIN